MVYDFFIAVCPIGSVQVGSQCKLTYSNKCRAGYTFDGNRCVIKFKNCPLNFELNEFDQCVQRQLCPQNHVWRNGRCEPPSPNCPSGWRWNRSQCEIIDVECPRGSYLRGNECISESFSCPIGFEQDGERCVEPKLFCPSGYKMKENGFCSQVTLRCPSGSIMKDGVCQRKFITCPVGTEKIGNQCYQAQPKRAWCPPGFQLIGDMCNMVTTQRPPDVLTCPFQVPTAPTTPTPPIEIKCADGFYRVGYNCYPLMTERPITQCPPGFYAQGNLCLQIQVPTTPPILPPVQVIECDEGFYRIGNNCYQNPTMRPVTRPPIVCPPGSYREGNQCVEIKIVEICQPGFFKHNGQCYPIRVTTVQPEIITIPVTYTTPSYRERTRCPESFVYQNSECYRCPSNFDLCDKKCVRSGQSCESSQSSHPNININISLPDQRATEKAHSIINHIAPINNTIININNITNPVSLNNVVKNNIHIYNDAQCPDGSIRTVVVKNNETSNGCVGSENVKVSENTRRSYIDAKEDEHPEKCCEVVTPRQCKTRQSNQWNCSHR